MNQHSQSDEARRAVRTLRDNANDAASDAGSSVRSHVERLGRDLETLRRRMTEMGSETGQAAWDGIEQGVARLRTELDHLTREAQVYGRDAAASLERQVQQRPFTALLSAFAVGILIAQLLFPRR